MNNKNTILIALLVIVVLAMTGCSHTAVAERKWQRVMDEAQMEAAQESIEQGRLDYAVCLLEELVESESLFADEARQLLDELRHAQQNLAQALSVTDDLRQSMLN